MIEIKGIYKSFDEENVLNNINLTIEKNSFVTILGPSGCGKTTLLKLISGFETPDKGEILIDKQVINNIPPNKRNVNTIFQKYALFPNYNVFENVAFGLRIQKKSKTEIEKEVQKALSLVNMTSFKDKNINDLSGGQQQRVAIARAIVCKPEILLLDEPLGALDLMLRKSMQYELRNLQKELGMTFLYVTHDQEEALTMSDKIVVMNKGKIQQIGTPVEVYDEPNNKFVAEFIGDSNIYEGLFIKSSNSKQVIFAGKEWSVEDNIFEDKEEVDVVIRPEDVILTPFNKEDSFFGTIKSIIYKGSYFELDVLTYKNFNIKVKTNDYWNIENKVNINILKNNIKLMKKG